MHAATHSLPFLLKFSVSLTRSDSSFSAEVQRFIDSFILFLFCWSSAFHSAPSDSSFSISAEVKCFIQLVLTLPFLLNLSVSSFLLNLLGPNQLSKHACTAYCSAGLYMHSRICPNPTQPYLIHNYASYEACPGHRLHVDRSPKLPVQIEVLQVWLYHGNSVWRLPYWRATLHRPNTICPAVTMAFCWKSKQRKNSIR